MFAICNTVMKATLLILFACLLPLPSPAADPEPYSFDLSAREILPMWSWQIRPGDQAEWATRPGAGSAWQTIRFDKYVSDYAAGEANGRFWLQASLDLRGAKDDSDALALFFTHLPSAFELFWDAWANCAASSPCPTASSLRAATGSPSAFPTTTSKKAGTISSSSSTIAHPWKN
jgi:hypothetical protein